MSKLTQHESVTVTARVPIDVAEQLRKVAAAHDRTISGELRRAVKRHLTLEASAED